MLNPQECESGPGPTDADPMFKYFPTNYVWNLSVDLAIEMGARIGEIEEMCAPLQEAARAADAAGTQAFRETWVRMADKLCGLADEDKSRGRLLSAGEKLNRAAIYLLTAERLQAHGAEGRIALYRRVLDVFAKGVQAARARTASASKSRTKASTSPPCTSAPTACRASADTGAGQRPRFDQGNALPRRPAGLARQARCVLAGGRSAGYGRGPAPAWHDGALRQRALGQPRSSTGSSGATMSTPARIGLEGVSLGGYFCPRAVAFEPRFACGVAWGANHDWRDVQKARREREGNFPVPHYWAHVCWVWGAADVDDFMGIAERGPSRWRRRAHQGAVPRYPRREGFADPAEMGAAHLRSARQQPEA